MNVLGFLQQDHKLYDGDNIGDYLDAINEHAPEGIRNHPIRQLYDISRRGNTSSFPIQHHNTFWSLEIGARMRNERNLFNGETWNRIWAYVRRNAGGGRPYLDTISPLMDQITELKRMENSDIPRNFRILLEIFYYFFSEIFRGDGFNQLEEIQVPNPSHENNEINPMDVNFIGTNQHLMRFNTPERRVGLPNLVQRFFHINMFTAQNYLAANAIKNNTWQQIFVNRSLSVDTYNLFLTFFHKILLWAVQSDYSPLQKQVMGFEVEIHRQPFRGDIIDNPYSLWLRLYMAFIQNLNYKLYKKIVRESINILPPNLAGHHINLAIPNEMGNLLYWSLDFEGLGNNFFQERNDRNTNVFGPNNNYPPRQMYGLVGQFRGSNINLSKLAGDFILNLLRLYPRPGVMGHYFNVVFRYWSNLEIPNTVWHRGYLTDNVNIPMTDVVLALEDSFNEVDGQDEHDREAFGFLVMQLIVHKISQKMLRYLEFYAELEDVEWDNPFQFVMGNLTLNQQLRLADTDALSGFMQEVSIIGFRYFGVVFHNNANEMQANRALGLVRAFHSASTQWCDIFIPKSGRNCILQIIEWLLKCHHKIFNKNNMWENEMEFIIYLQSLMSENLYRKLNDHISKGEVWECLKIYNSLDGIIVKCVLYVYNSNVTIFKNEYYTERENVKIILLLNSEIGVMSKGNFDKLESFRRNSKKWWEFPTNPNSLRKVMKKSIDSDGEILEYFDKKNQYIIFGKNENKKSKKKVIFQKAENGLMEEWGWVECEKKKRNSKKRKLNEEQKLEGNKFENFEIWGWDVETVILNYNENEKWHKYSCYCICFTNKNGEKKVFWGEDCIKDLIDWISDLIRIHSQNEEQIKKDGKKYILFYSFNGARFDNIFLLKQFLFCFHLNLKIIGKPENIKCMILYDLIYFMDSRLIYTQGSLQKLSKDLLKEEKKDFDIMKVIKSPKLYEDNKEEIIKYCLQDCVLVCKLIEKKREFIESLFTKFSNKEEFLLFKWFQPTLSLLSINLWKKLFPPKDNVFGCQDWDLYNIEKSSYKGGMCIPIVREFNASKNKPFLYHYDIVSSYPFAMKEFQMPICFLGSKDYKSKPWNICGYGEIKLTNLYCVRFKFKEGFKIPFFPIRINLNGKINGLIYLQSNYENPEPEWIWGIELVVAMPYLVKLECYEIKRYSEGFIFTEFILSLYEERKKAKLEKNDSFAFFLKLIMNSAYGKFGQQKFSNTEIIHGNQFNEYLVDKKLSEKNVADSDYIQGLKNVLPFTEPIEGAPYFLITHHPDDDLNFIGGCVRISSYIAACARVRLIQGFIDVGFENVYYFDTDSIFTSKKMSNNMIGEDLGRWSIEHDEIVEAYFINSKVYAFKMKNGEISLKCKGIPRKFLTWEMFQELRKNKECNITKIHQMKHVLNNIYLNEEFVKKVTILDIKRKYDKNGDSISFTDLNDALLYNKKYLPKKLLK